MQLAVILTFTRMLPTERMRSPLKASFFGRYRAWIDQPSDSDRAGWQTYQSFIQLILDGSIGPHSAHFIETDQFSCRKKETSLNDVQAFLRTVQIEDTKW